jgi:hypothetical protein
MMGDRVVAQEPLFYEFSLSMAFLSPKRQLMVA